MNMQTPPPMMVNPLVTAPILPTLVRLSLPNMIAMLAATLVAIAETIYVGRLGTPALAGMALVFPMVMLQQMMSAGAMGGGVSSAISRALGAGNDARAGALAYHAVLIGIGISCAFTLLFLTLGREIYTLLGGRDAALREAIVYSNVIFAGAAGIWLTNILASIVRGCGNMKIPSATLFAVAAAQVVLGGGLGLGLGPFPRLGMVGVGLGQVLAYAGGAAFLVFFLLSDRARVRLAPQKLDVERFKDILRVGALACLSPLQTVLTVLILTGFVAAFGTATLAGYGIGARLEFLLVPITFGIGVACVPMVGMAVGAGDIVRARRVAWTAGTLSAAIVGSVGLVVTLWPDLWAQMFTDDPAVLAAARQYLTLSGPGYVFLGMGLCLYFASQGAGKLLGPVLAGTLRLAVIAIGGWALMRGGAPYWTLFALVGFAMAVHGVATVAAVYFVSWDQRRS